MKKEFPTMRLFCLLFFCLLSLSAGCGGGGGGGESATTGGDKETQDLPPLPTSFSKHVRFDLSFPGTSGLNSEPLTVVTLYGTYGVDPAKGKSVYAVATDTGGGQVAILSDAQGTPLFYSYFEAASGVAEIDSEGIAKGLLWMNPYVLSLPADRKTEFMEKAVASSMFPQLTGKIESLLANDPKNLLNPDRNPDTVKVAFALVKETGEALNGTQAKGYRDIGSPGAVRILDKDGGTIAFENPEMVVYGAEIADSQGGKRYEVIERVKSFSAFQWWPPVVKSPPVETTLSLADGRYRITLYKGFSLEEGNWWLPYDPSNPGHSAGATIVGTATWYNTLIMMGQFTGAVAGISTEDRIASLMTKAAEQAGSMTGFADLAQAVNGGDSLVFTEALVDFLRNGTNWNVLARMLWDAGGIDAVPFLDAAKTLVKNTSTVLRTVDWANEPIPFIDDLGFAPSKAEFCIEQENGVLSECSDVRILLPPVASLAASPLNPYVGDTVSFDAAASTDESGAALSYRFDFNGDGQWDTDWSSSGTASHTYTEKGTYNTRVEVRDSDGLTSLANYYITVDEKEQGISVAIVIDKSSSMAGLDGSGKPLADAKTAAKTYVNYMGTADRGAVISFDGTVTVQQSFTGDKALLTAAIDAIKAGEHTAFYDAVYRALQDTALEDSTRRRAVIAMTDGLDNYSVMKSAEREKGAAKMQDVIAYARQLGIPVYTIGLQGQGYTAETESILRDFATQTGGLFLSAPSSSALQSIYNTIAGIQ
ncbi:MAG: VWA domain-containing protein [Alphaproteobacteria bacterium]|uniref:VWA domain-containing protein n=1 Tax=Candidatus Nitrobium versatile TaxID=2884831 RepID=A0A953JBD6_9BACT|nr:VWA domain-containing protein [Candidatus Nitrobium versatile]